MQGRERVRTLISPKTPPPHNQPMEGRKYKIVRDKKERADHGNMGWLCLVGVFALIECSHSLPALHNGLQLIIIIIILIMKT